MTTTEAVHPITAEPEPVAIPAPEPSTPQNGAVSKMFRYSEYLNVGEGAAECPQREPGVEGELCVDPEHFHAWCRLPNPIQQENIRKKAAAAKARAIRQYADDESDESVVLDSELAQIHDEIFADNLIDELIAADFPDDYTTAQGNVEADERFEHIVEDRTEFTRLDEGGRPLEEQSAEYRALAGHITEYIAALRAEIDTIQKPKRDELASRGIERLIELIRDRRVEEHGQHAFLDTFNTWMWLVGTHQVERSSVTKRPYKPMWSELGRADEPAPGTLFAAAPEVISGLRNVYNGLQIQLQKASSGN